MSTDLFLIEAVVAEEIKPLTQNPEVSSSNLGSVERTPDSYNFVQDRTAKSFFTLKPINPRTKIETKL